MSQIAPRVERLHDGRPIVTKREDHDWESKVTFNPASALLRGRGEIEKLVAALPVGGQQRDRLLREKGLVALLYRAQGRKLDAYDHTRSSLGLAICSPGLELLARLDPSPVVRLNRAIAVAELAGPEVALAEVDGLPLEGYHAFHATRADLLRRLGRSEESRAAYDRAIALAGNTAERASLARRRDELTEGAALGQTTA